MFNLKYLVPSLVITRMCAQAFTAAQTPDLRTATAQTRQVQVDGHQIAYRVIGNAPGVPLLLLNRFRGTMDHWDPLLIDRISAERQVLMFDQPGFARSGGDAPDSLAMFAASAAKVLAALGYSQVDVLGFSMGGTVALQFALDYPLMTRRLVIAGSGPGYVPEVPTSDVVDGTRVWPVATKAVNDDADFLYLFFEDSPTSQAAGKAYLARLTARRDAFSKQVEAAAWQAQLRSAQAVSSADRSLLPRLANIKHPVLVANGRHDIMVPSFASYAMAKVLPHARLVIYPDSGHGFLFQHAEQFADEVSRFLR